ncbi:hypothetical protein [Streptomyces sp. NPDC057238]|uniref:hypothetical protein n=1 Tax=Streptomyces sp. NPDC057238 TaxID=3346060 RepID=UPI00362A7729
MLAVGDEQLQGVDFWRTDEYRSFVPPLRTDVGRALAGSPERWAHRFAQYLTDAPDSPLHEGRWLLSCESPLRRWRHADVTHAEYWNSMLVDGHPDGYIDWFVHSGSWEVLPPRPMPDADDSRAKAYRTVPRDDLAARIDEAVGSYEDELARFAGLRALHGPTVPDGAATAGPRLVRLLHGLNTAEQSTWAWPLPGGEEQWRRIAHEVTAGQGRPRT